MHTPALRGFQSDSKRSPLGINGEGLDTAIASLDEAQRAELEERAGCVSWFKKLDIDEDDRLKLQGFKLGRSALGSGGSAGYGAALGSQEVF